jgi:hypothetical protein
VPGGYASWFWGLLSKPSHQMRVRIASRVYNSHTQDSPSRPTSKGTGSGYDTNIFDNLDFKQDADGKKMGIDIATGITDEEQKVLERVAEDLARLGRVKRVGLGVEEKVQFIKVWGSRKR